MMTGFAEEKESEIAGWLQSTAESLKDSFDNFWPSDTAGKNDPCEQNVAFHFAHTLLSDGFSVFAEANHPHEAHGRIDLLALNPGQNWYLAVEFKKIWSGTQEALRDDLNKLEQYWLSEFDSDTFGQRRIESVKHNERGIGMVAGLLWVLNSDTSPLLEFWKTQGKSGGIKYANELLEIADRLNCVWLKPVKAWQETNGSKYYLLALAFDIPQVKA